MLTMFIIFFRSLFIFLILLILLRLMGKRQIGEMQPFELVITLIIADLATIPMADVSIPLFYGIVGIVTLFILHQVISFIDRKNKNMSNLISGKPTIVINAQGINFEEMKKQNIGIEDLLESLRGAGYASLDEVAFAIFETNGKLSVIPKNTNENEKPAALPIVIIQKGEIQENEQKELNFSKVWLLKILNDHDIFSLKNIQLATLDNNGKLYIQIKDEGYRVIQSDYRTDGNM